MTQAPGALPAPTVLDHERTLAAQIPGLPGVKAKRSIEPTPEALMAAIEDYRTRAVKAGQSGWSRSTRQDGQGFGWPGGWHNTASRRTSFKLPASLASAGRCPGSRC
jgi:hypothetical protein